MFQRKRNSKAELERGRNMSETILYQAGDGCMMLPPSWVVWERRDKGGKGS